MSKVPRGLTLNGPQAGKHGGAAGRAGAPAVPTPAPVQAGGGLHRDLVLEVCGTQRTEEQLQNYITSGYSITMGQAQSNRSTYCQKEQGYTLPSQFLTLVSYLPAIQDSRQEIIQRSMKGTMKHL